MVWLRKMTCFAYKICQLTGKRVIGTQIFHSRARTLSILNDCEYMTFLYSQSFIHRFTGLFGTNVMTSFQLACTLSWQSTGTVQQRSWIQIPCRPKIFPALFSLLLKQRSSLRRLLSYSRGLYYNIGTMAHSNAAPRRQDRKLDRTSCNLHSVWITSHS